MKNEGIASSLFYLTNKLKDVVKRKGWYKRDIQRHRVESVADHIFGSQMLAYAMYSEFHYDVDIHKVIFLLAIHELAEAILGDYTPKDISKKEKSILERRTVIELSNMIPNGEFLKKLYLEYEAQETKEAIFAFQVEHAECDLQAKLYVEEGCFAHKYNQAEFVENWIGFDRKRLPYDENFDLLLEYVSNNDTKITPHQENSLQNVISFYKLTNSLKDKPKKGEVNLNLYGEKYGSIAEHVYSAQMLELIVYMIYSRDMDIFKAMALKSVSELGEVLYRGEDSSVKADEEKNILAKEVAGILTNGDTITTLLDESYALKTKEALFSCYCDKFALDIINRIHEQKNADLNKQEDCKSVMKGDNLYSKYIQEEKDIFKYPEPIMSISDYVTNHHLSEPYSKVLSKKLGIKTI